jgi:hypothetical protein
MDECRVLGEGSETIAGEPIAFHEALDMSEEKTGYVFVLARQPTLDQGPLIHEVSRSHIRRQRRR